MERDLAFQSYSQWNRMRWGHAPSLLVVDSQQVGRQSHSSSKLTKKKGNGFSSDFILSLECVGTEREGGGVGGSISPSYGGFHYDVAVTPVPFKSNVTSIRFDILRME